MSQKKVPNRRQERLRQMPHSEKSADSAKESHTSKQEVAKLTTQLHNVTGLADWAQNRADFYWKQEKEYEAQGRVDMALEAKTMYEEQALRAKNYNREIKQIEKMIDKLSLVYSVGLKKGENYAMMKVEEPPSDNED